MRPTLKQLQYLVAIADKKKFADAARIMNVSQPSLSAQVADMEQELGTVLVERGRHGAILTPIGEDIVKKARAIIASVEELKSQAVADKDEFLGRLRLGVVPTIGPYLLPSVTNKLHQMYPNFRISVREERTTDLDKHLKEGRLDTLISTIEDHSNVDSLPLFEEALWICVASDHPLASTGPTIKPEHLSGMPLLSLGYGHNLSSTIRELARLSGAFVSQEYEGTSLDAIRQMAAMGAGIAVLPSLYAIVEAQRDSSLIVKRIKHPIASRRIALIWRDTSPMKVHMQQLADILKGVAREILSKQ